jgi:preprotein translocase subunit SecE
MSAKAKIQDAKSSIDKFFWILIIVLVCIALGVDYYFSEIAWSLRLAGWIVLACILLVIVSQTRQGKKVWQFAKEARIELRKVVWPSRQITLRTTAIVACLVVITALIMWGVDSILLFIIGWLTGQRG